MTTAPNIPTLDWLAPIEPARLGEMTEDAYATEPGVRSSLLREVDRSPYHALRSVVCPREATESLVLGQLLHAMLLEPQTVSHRFAVSSNRKTWRGAANAMTGLPAGVTAITAEMLTKSLTLATAVRSHPEAAELLDGDGANEDVYLWSDPLTGIACKCRVDRLRLTSTDGGKRRLRVPDIKTTSGGCGARQFARTVQDYGYDLQAAHYLAGIEAVWGVRAPWLWIVVETDTGAVAVHRADPELIEWADGRRQRLLATLADSIKTSRWDMPAGSVIERPRWAKE